LDTADFLLSFKQFFFDYRKWNWQKKSIFETSKLMKEIFIQFKTVLLPPIFVQFWKESLSKASLFFVQFKTLLLIPLFSTAGDMYIFKQFAATDTADQWSLNLTRTYF
jgi:hypothetical protein